MRKKQKNTAKQALMRLLFLAYVAGMIWLLFGQRWGSEAHTQRMTQPVNLEPFATVKLYWWILQNSKNTALLTHAFVNLVGNVVMFIPLGFYVPYLGKKLRKFFPAMAVILLLILTIEAVQYVTYLGSCDVDDVILNMAGALFGYLFYRIKCR